MLNFITSLIANFIAKLGWGWWASHKKLEAENAQNDVSAMADTAVNNKLRDDYTRK